MKGLNHRIKRNGNSPTILVAALHWGLGHATRCIPVIRELLASGFEVLIASDGAALDLLRKEFPQLECIELPSYDISYARKPVYFKAKLLLKLPHFQKTIAAEKKLVKKLVKEGVIHGIISDSRLGVRNSQVPSVLITHQLNVLSGSTSWLSSKLHRKVIDKFDQCWVPDTTGPNNLSGKLGHPKNIPSHVKYIGWLSRLKPQSVPRQYDICCLLSGPEPQRGMLEQKYIDIFSHSKLRVLLVRGVVEVEQTRSVLGNLSVVNYLTSEDIQKVINESETIVSRSGYTTIMDLAVMGKKAFFIPTPGQYEQEYLARRLKSEGIIPSCSEQEFNLQRLNEIKLYKGFEIKKSEFDLSELFGLFKSK